MAGCTTVSSPNASAAAVYQGESKSFRLSVTQPNPAYPCTSETKTIPLNLTGTTLTFTVKSAVISPDVLIRKTSADINQIEIIDGPGGVALIKFDPADTNLLSPNSYVFDVWVTLVSGKRHPVIQPSTLKVLQPVTRF